MYFSEQLFSLFEPITGPLSIMYANGQEWEDRRKWIYDSLKGPVLESYIPIFIKVNVRLYFICLKQFSEHNIVVS